MLTAHSNTFQVSIFIFSPTIEEMDIWIIFNAKWGANVTALQVTELYEKNESLQVKQFAGVS